jgi:probable rRNA maturation factor
VPKRTTSKSASSRSAATRTSAVGVDVARDDVTVAISETRVREIVQFVCRRLKVPRALISVTFLPNRAMARMNRDYLDHRGPTDIITFQLDATDGVIMGDMYIAPEVARENALAHGAGVREELVRLVVHGTLHVLGYTHPDGDERMQSAMWRTQEQLVRALV